jgi:UDP-N-acetylglucosamine--N-acetylmuramyl-(pentapeptide) pyrophosphoryl-undecaprenol N-acetylglucosamine transferase
MRRVALVAGGTAGHVYPALEVGRAYQQAVPDARVLFIGTTNGFESRLVPAHGYRLELVPGAPLFGVGIAGKALAIARLLTGARRARTILRNERIELAIGFGGFSSAGTMLAARTLGLHTAILESNASPGLTNRLLGRVVSRTYLGCAMAGAAFEPTKTLVTGVPVRPEIMRTGTDRRANPDGRFHVLVTGGSHGSDFLNRHAAELLRFLAARGVAVDVRHQAGAWDLEAASRTYARAGISVSVTSYIEDMADAYAWAHFAISCAGAGTLAELAASGLPALLVPLAGASEDHQTANARTFTAVSGGLWVRENDWHPDVLATRIADLLTHTDSWGAASQRLRRLANAEAASAIVADCEAALGAF